MTDSERVKLEIGGATMAVRLAGAREKPALLLIPGFPSSFDLAETLSWMEALPRMEAHILDGPHFLLETHAAECAARMSAFIRRVERPS